MRLAIFSDVHGNPFALEAVLQAIEQEGGFDLVLAAGDLALGGSDPAGCVDRLRERGILAVYGNTETYLLQPEHLPPDELHLQKWGHIRAQVAWARPLLGEARLAWLGALPFDLRFSPGASPEDDLLLFHGNPKDIVEFIYPPPEEQLRYFGQVLQPDDSPALAALMEGVQARTCVFGHMHITSTRFWRGYTLINVAPCSLPALEKDPRARYTVLEWVKDRWRFTRRFVDYDYRQEVAALRACGMPFFEDYASAFP